MLRILLTGGSGFVGGRLSAGLSGGYKICAPSRAELDVTDEYAFRRAAADFSPDVVIHAAAVADTAYCEAHETECFGINVAAAQTAARAAEDNGARLVFFSSEQVYNGSAGLLPHSETDVCTPVNVYGRQKLEAESRISEVCTDSVLLRLTWMYDLPRSGMKTGANLLVRLLDAAARNVSVSFPVNEYRGVTPVGDVIGALERAFAFPSGIYNFGCSNELSTYETALFFCRRLGADAQLCIPDTERFRAKPRNIAVTCAKALAAGVDFPTSAEAFTKFAEMNGL